jgi:glycosyltransferase involved in cell wall biosynthesis
VNNSVKILHLTCTHQPADDRIFYRECLSLAERYSPVMIIGVGDENECKIIRDIRTLSVKDDGYKANIRKILAEARKIRPELVHVHDLFILEDALGYARALNIPLIYDVHEHFPLLIKRYLSGNWLKKNLHRFYWGYKERKLSKKAQHIITVVPQLTDRFFRWNASVTEIRNYPRKGVFEVQQRGAVPPETDKMLHFARGRIILIYAGDISKHRDLALFAETVSALNRRGYACAGVTLGSGKKNDVESWEALCREKKGEMLHLGHIPHEKIPGLLREAHIGWSVLPDIALFNISLPNKIFEYLACGLPFVASNMCNIRHLFWKNPAALIFQDEDAEGIASLIQSAFPDRERLNELKQRARETFLNRFTWESEESKLLDVYKTMIRADRDNDEIQR